MAEEFLEEIYKDALIIEQVREYIVLVNAGKDRDARTMYNRAATGLERILAELPLNNRELADEIMDAAVSIRDTFDDTCKATAIAEGKLIPLLFSFLSDYTGIDVEAGKYGLSSASSGFLMSMIRCGRHIGLRILYLTPKLSAITSWDADWDICLISCGCDLKGQ